MKSANVLDIERCSRSFGDLKALDDVSISARRGEFLTILGQSGSGKTTLLRVISGLQQPSSVSRLEIGGQDVRSVPAYKRNVSTVFQHFGLFPHMTVGENIEYGLKLRKVEPQVRRQRARAMLDTVRLPDKFDRRINQLSGGERQRVALARSLVLEPEILLLDEPLGALDERLRLDMQIELVQIQRQLGTTFIFITHSQEEAITMSDRVVLMRRGRIVQDASPEELFERPNSAFAGSFMGVENMIRGKVARILEGGVELTIEGASLLGKWTGPQTPVIGQDATLMIRAERISLGRRKVETPAGTSLAITTRNRVYKGKYVDLVADSKIGEIIARNWDRGVDQDAADAMSWAMDDAFVVPGHD